MAVTPFKFSPLFRKPKNVKIPKRLGVRAVDVEFSNNFFSDTAGYSKSRFELNVRKNACNKIISQIFAFLIIAVGLFYNNYIRCKISELNIQWCGI